MTENVNPTPPRDAEADLAVCEGATDGDWELHDGGRPDYSICIANGDGTCGPLFERCGPDDGGVDGEFIILSRTALPHWIRRAQRAEADNAALDARNRAVEGFLDKAEAEVERLRATRACECGEDDACRLHVENERLNARVAELEALSSIASSYRVGDSFTVGSREITVERARQLSGPDKWAVRYGDRYCYNHSGELEYEPIPSERGDDFIARCRWDSLEDALAVARVESARRGVRMPSRSPAGQEV